jgi:hypothetical protein
MNCIGAVHHPNPEELQPIESLVQVSAVYDLKNEVASGDLLHYDGTDPQTIFDSRKEKLRNLCTILDKYEDLKELIPTIEKKIACEEPQESLFDSGYIAAGLITKIQTAIRLRQMLNHVVDSIPEYVQMSYEDERQYILQSSLKHQIARMKKGLQNRAIQKAVELDREYDRRESEEGTSG